jgi:hypothetical protein
VLAFDLAQLLGALTAISFAKLLFANSNSKISDPS